MLAPRSARPPRPRAIPRENAASRVPCSSSRRRRMRPSRTRSSAPVQRVAETGEIREAGGAGQPPDEARRAGAGPGEDPPERAPDGDRVAVGERGGEERRHLPVLAGGRNAGGTAAGRSRARQPSPRPTSRFRPLPHRPPRFRPARFRPARRRPPHPRLSRSRGVAAENPLHRPAKAARRHRLPRCRRLGLPRKDLPARDPGPGDLTRSSRPAKGVLRPRLRNDFRPPKVVVALEIQQGEVPPGRPAAASLPPRRGSGADSWRAAAPPATAGSSPAGPAGRAPAAPRSRGRRCRRGRSGSRASSRPRGAGRGRWRWRPRSRRGARPPAPPGRLRRRAGASSWRRCRSRRPPPR